MILSQCYYLVSKINQKYTWWYYKAYAFISHKAKYFQKSFNSSCLKGSANFASKCYVRLKNLYYYGSKTIELHICCKNYYFLLGWEGTVKVNVNLMVIC